MKRIYYPYIAFIKRIAFLFLTGILVFGVTTRAQQFSLFSPGGIPTSESNDGGQAIEVGFKFRVTQLGTLNLIRFYKYSGNGNGSFTANLWTNGNSTTPGINLSTATNASIAGAGWMTIDIPDVVLMPGITYVISIFSPSGWYAFTNGYFPVTPDDPGFPPFIIVASADDPASVGNGVWRYTTTSAFPFNNGNTTNYWVDPVFTTTFTLPVSLSDFKATTTSNNVLVSWKTDHESNNKGFEIQRSNNGSDWYAVNFVNGAGESTITRNYSYTDKGLAPGTYYYRLKQTDLDGKNTFSSIVTATVSGKGNVSLFQNYPNPFSTSTFIRFDLPTAQHARLSVVDLAGREVKVLTDKVSEAGSHVVTLDAANLSRQTYLVRLQTENGVLTKKILVK